MGRPHEINCTLYIGELYKVNPDDVSISWMGSGDESISGIGSGDESISWMRSGDVIANESSRITVIPTTSNGSVYTSTLQFSYISEEDENTSYNCTASLSGGHGSLSKSFTMSNLTSKLNYYHVP